MVSNLDATKVDEKVDEWVVTKDDSPEPMTVVK